VVRVGKFGISPDYVSVVQDIIIVRKESARYLLAFSSCWSPQVTEPVANAYCFCTYTLKT
jgi:hypothetical protein